MRPLGSLGLLAALLLAPAAGAAIPTVLQHQGRVTDALGDPLNGEHPLTARIYASPEGEAPLWSETHPAVRLTAGAYAVTLGSRTPFPEDLFATGPRYLGLSVGGGEELAPRSQLVPVPLARTALGLEVAATAPLGCDSPSEVGRVYYDAAAGGFMGCGPLGWERFTTRRVGGFGDGSDGAHVVAGASETINAYAALTSAAIPAGARSLAVASSAGFGVGDAVLVLQVQHPSLAGTWELGTVAGVGPTALTLEDPLQNAYASGVGGASPQAAQVVRVPQYSALTVAPGARLTAPAWNGQTGGVIAALSTGAIEILGEVDAQGLGFRGGAGGSGANASNAGGQGGQGGETVTGYLPRAPDGGGSAGGAGHVVANGVKGGSSEGGVGYGGGGEGIGGGGGGGGSDAQRTSFTTGRLALGPGAGGGGGGGGGNRGFDGQHGGSGGGGGGGAGGGIVLLQAATIELSGAIDVGALRGAGGGGGTSAYPVASIVGAGGAGGRVGGGGGGRSPGGAGLTGGGAGGTPALDPCGGVTGGAGGSTGVPGGGDGGDGDNGLYDANGGGGAGASGGGGGGGGYDVAGGGGGGQGGGGGVVYLRAYTVELGTDRIAAAGGVGGGGGGGTTGDCAVAGAGGTPSSPSGGAGFYGGDRGGGGGAAGHPGAAGIVRIEYRDAVAGSAAGAQVVSFTD